VSAWAICCHGRAFLFIVFVLLTISKIVQLQSSYTLHISLCELLCRIRRSKLHNLTYDLVESAGRCIYRASCLSLMLLLKWSALFLRVNHYKGASITILVIMAGVYRRTCLIVMCCSACRVLAELNTSYYAIGSIVNTFYEKSLKKSCITEVRVLQLEYRKAHKLLTI